MPKSRILIVDDSVVIRRLVSEELSKDPELEVVGVAAHGRIALTKLPQLNPDVVILDIEMPEIDGLTTLAEIRKTNPKMPVIMFSTLTERGGVVTLEALSLGASDFATKPTSQEGLAASLDALRSQLIPKIKALCNKRSTEANPFPTVEKRAGKFLSTIPFPAKPEVLVIGASTGGPNALAEVFKGLGKDFPLPILVVQHMPPMFTRLLAERLTTQSGGFAVAEGIEGTVLKSGQGWVAPGDYHMTVNRTGTKVSLRLNQDPPENSCRPAVDVLFRSVAQAYAGNILAVILTGMGQDGLRGCEFIREAGGQIIAQDEATSVVWGMPGFVTRAGLADKVLPITEIAPEIHRRITRS